MRSGSCSVSSRLDAPRRAPQDWEAAVGRWVRFDPGGRFRNRVFSAWSTFWLFLGRVSQKDGTCREAVRKARAWRSAAKAEPISPNTAAYCQARARLPLEPLLGDRGFCSFAEVWSLLQRRVDSVVRLHQRRSVGVRRRRRLGKNDWRGEWIKTGAPPKGMDRETWRQLPATILVRQLTVHVHIPGFRTTVPHLVITLTDSIIHRADKPLAESR